MVWINIKYDNTISKVEIIAWKSNCEPYREN